MKKNLITMGLLIMGLMVSDFMPQTTVKALAAEESNDNVAFEMTSEKVNELWVGDVVSAYGPYDAISIYTTYTVLEGNSVWISNSEFSGSKICAVKEGYSKVQAEYRNYKNGSAGMEEDLEIVGTEIFEINVVDRPDKVKFIDIPESIKLGQQVDFKVENANYGSIPGIYISEANNSFCMPGYGGAAAFRTWRGLLFTAVKYDDDGTIAKNGNNLATIAFYPGTYKYGMYEDIHNGYDEEAEPIGTGTLVVEEPVIETNAPESVKNGSVLEFRTGLRNLYMEDEKIAKLFKAIYEPEITILEGADCVERSDMVYEDLSTVESIKFIKDGTVTLQVRYVADVNYDEYSSEPEIYGPLDGNYVPELYTSEKIIKITVNDEEIKEETKVTDGRISEKEAEKLELEAIVEGIDENAKLEINTISDTDEGLKTVLSNEKLQGKKFAVADLKLMADGVIQPGKKIKITLPVMENIKDAKYVEVFRMNNETKELDSLCVVPVENGKITFETDHFSTYVFMETSEITEAPKTGDISNMLFIPLLISILLVIGCVINSKGKKLAD